jgi:hypothetical protein
MLSQVRNRPATARLSSWLSARRTPLQIEGGALGEKPGAPAIQGSPISLIKPWLSQGLRVSDEGNRQTAVSASSSLDHSPTPPDSTDTSALYSTLGLAGESWTPWGQPSELPSSLKPNKKEITRCAVKEAEPTEPVPWLFRTTKRPLPMGFETCGSRLVGRWRSQKDQCLRFYTNAVENW